MRYGSLGINWVRSIKEGFLLAVNRSGVVAGLHWRVFATICSAFHHVVWRLLAIMVVFTWCQKGARCKKCNTPETSRGIHWREKHWRGEKEREEKQARSHKNNIQKKNLFYFSCAQKDKIKEPNRTEAMRKSQEWLQQPRMDMTLHLALAPSPPQSHVRLSLESISRAAYGWVCRQFCNCHCLIPPSCFASLPPSWAQPSSTLWCLWGPSEALTLSVPKRAAMILIYFPFFSGTKWWVFFSSSANQKFL